MVSIRFVSSLVQRWASVAFSVLTFSFSPMLELRKKKKKKKKDTFGSLISLTIGIGQLGQTLFCLVGVSIVVFGDTVWARARVTRATVALAPAAFSRVGVGVRGSCEPAGLLATGADDG